jgi:hypothetical protein
MPLTSMLPELVLEHSGLGFEEFPTNITDVITITDRFQHLIFNIISLVRQARVCRTEVLDVIFLFIIFP